MRTACRRTGFNSVVVFMWLPKFIVAVAVALHFHIMSRRFKRLPAHGEGIREPPVLPRGSLNVRQYTYFTIGHNT
jgi:hypothetical protein